MTSVLDVYNMALGSIGARAKLTATSDNAREAEVCNMFYTLARNEVFSAIHWNELRARAQLAQVTGASNDDYLRGYALPADCVRPRYIVGYPPFEVEARVLYTNMEQPRLVYTRSTVPPSEWESPLLSLVVAQLAFHIAYPVTRSSEALRNAASMAESKYVTSLTLAANTDQRPLEEHIPDWIQARGTFLQNTAQTQFIYPVQTLSYTHALNQVQL